MRLFEQTCLARWLLDMRTGGRVLVAETLQARRGVLVGGTRETMDTPQAARPVGANVTSGPREPSPKHTERSDLTATWPRGRARQVFCKRGHLIDDDTHRPGKGRFCRQCGRERVRPTVQVTCIDCGVVRTARVGKETSRCKPCSARWASGLRHAAVSATDYETWALEVWATMSDRDRRLVAHGLAA